MTGPRLIHNASYRPPTPRGGDWRDEAVCVDVDTTLFYVPGAPIGWETELGKWQATEARAICSACPVRNQCLADALRMGDRDGFLGGMTPQERDRFARSQKRPSRSKETA